MSETLPFVGWIPLECNPDIFNTWANKAGLVSTDRFEDLYGLDPDSLAAVPRPVKAVVLVQPWQEELARRAAAGETTIKEGEPNVDKNVFWVKQTVENICGSMALIHSLSNSDVDLAAGSPLRTFIDECKDKSPFDRPKILKKSPILTDIHASLSSHGQSTAPSADIHVDQGYTCFVSAPGPGSTGKRVIEMDGTQRGPIDRGECSDLLEDVARFIRDDIVKNSKSLKFSIMYLG